MQTLCYNTSPRNSLAKPKSHEAYHEQEEMMQKKGNQSYLGILEAQIFVCKMLTMQLRHNTLRYSVVILVVEIRGSYFCMQNAVMHQSDNATPP